MSPDRGRLIAPERPGEPAANDVPESLRRIACVGVSHETVPTERLPALAPDDPIAFARSVKDRERITEAVVLATCNRVEVYVGTRTADRHDLDTARAAARTALGTPEGTVEYTGLAAAEHLFRVACGLESAILGEDQILGQVRRAFERARQSDVAGGVLTRVAEAAVRAGRKGRRETGINDGEIGYAGAICGFIEDGLDRPPERVLIVGAGEMAETATAALSRRWDVRIDVANRSRTDGLTTADGRYWPLSSLPDALADVDAIVTATGAQEAILSREHAKHCAPGTPAVDLATPPDISTQARAILDVADLDDTAARVTANERDRREDVTAVEGLIDDALSSLVARERENRAEDVLRDLHRKAARMRRSEIDRACSRLVDGDADAETVLADFASALTGRLLADPTETLRTAARTDDEEMIAAAARLFDLDGTGGAEP